MNSMYEKLVAFVRDEEGLTATEYAIAGGLVGAAVIGAFTELGTAVGDVITFITDAINASPAAGGAAAPGP